MLPAPPPGGFALHSYLHHHTYLHAQVHKTWTLFLHLRLGHLILILATHSPLLGPPCALVEVILDTLFGGINQHPRVVVIALLKSMLEHGLQGVLVFT